MKTITPTMTGSERRFWIRQNEFDAAYARMLAAYDGMDAGCTADAPDFQAAHAELMASCNALQAELHRSFHI